MPDPAETAAKASPPAEAPRRRTIGTADDLRACLASPDASLRRAVLDAVAAQPDALLARIPVHEVEAALLTAWEKAEIDADRLRVVRALTVCDTPTTDRFFLDLLRDADEDDLRLLAAERLRNGHLDEAVAALIEDDAAAPTARRLAANLVARASCLTPRQAVRATLVADVAVPGAAWSEATEAAWLEVLRADEPRAVDVLARAGHSPLDLAPWFDTFGPAVQRAIAAWAAESGLLDDPPA